MFAKLIEIALKSALENPEIKERLRIKNEEVKVNLMKQENNLEKTADKIRADLDNLVNEGITKLINPIELKNEVLSHE